MIRTKNAVEGGNFIYGELFSGLYVFPAGKSHISPHQRIIVQKKGVHAPE
jgi:hypothetical protein